MAARRFFWPLVRVHISLSRARRSELRNRTLLKSPTAAAAVDQRLRADLDDDLAARLAGIDVVTDAALQR
jgi:hypothetical protein